MAFAPQRRPQHVEGIRRQAAGGQPAPAVQPAESTHEPAIPFRAVDDSDVGWGTEGDGNDDRLRRDKPPHW